jgi:hypothetical protein
VADDVLERSACGFLYALALTDTEYDWRMKDAIHRYADAMEDE